MDLTKSSTATGRATIGPKGRVTIPRAIRDLFQFHPGDEVVFQVTDGRIEVVPMALITRDRVWFYGDAMQARVLEAETQIAEGRTTRVSSGAELDAHLDNLDVEVG